MPVWGTRVQKACIGLLELPLPRPRLGGFGSVFPQSSGSDKSEISASAGLVFLGGLPPWLVGGLPVIFPLRVCVLISSSCKDTSIVGLGSTPNDLI